MIIIDRFEGEYAVCEEEDESFVKIPKVFLPKGSREGDCLVPAPDGSWCTDREETLRRRRRIQEKLKSLYR